MSKSWGTALFGLLWAWGFALITRNSLGEKSSWLLQSQKKKRAVQKPKWSCSNYEHNWNDPDLK